MSGAPPLADHRFPPSRPPAPDRRRDRHGHGFAALGLYCCVSVGGKMSSTKGEGAVKGARSDSTSAPCRAQRCGPLSAGASRCTRSHGVPAGSGTGGQRERRPAGRAASAGEEGPGSVLTAAQSLAHADQQLGAHPWLERLSRATAPGAELVQHARQRQCPDLFHGAYGKRVLGGAGAGAGPGAQEGERPGRGMGPGGGTQVCDCSPSSGASSSSCLWARGSSWWRCAGVPEHSSRARPGSTPCIASIRSKQPRAEPWSSVAATRAAPSAWVSACPLSQRRAPPAGRSELKCSGSGSVAPGPTPLTCQLTKLSDQVPQVRRPLTVQAKQRLLHLQGVAHAATQGVVHGRQSGCNPKPQTRPYTNLWRHGSLWSLPCLPHGLL